MQPAKLTILYFAWLRERTGRAEEQLTPPETVRTIADLITWLAQRSPGHAAAFAHTASIRCAINQEFCDPTAPISPGDEIAFFPPVTGG